MPNPNDSAAATDLTVDRERHTLRFTRRVAAGCAEVFDAWTRPERVAQWWDPTGEPLESCRIDLRVGGGFSFVNRGRPDMPFAGVYREISPPRRLEFDANGAIGRVLLADDGQGARVTVEIECTSAEQFAMYLQMKVDVGTSRTLDNLVRHLDRVPA